MHVLRSFLVAEFSDEKKDFNMLECIQLICFRNHVFTLDILSEQNSYMNKIESNKKHVTENDLIVIKSVYSINITGKSQGRLICFNLKVWVNKVVKLIISLNISESHYQIIYDI
jgi:hypothetical protein